MLHAYEKRLPYPMCAPTSALVCPTDSRPGHRGSKWTPVPAMYSSSVLTHSWCSHPLLLPVSLQWVYSESTGLSAGVAADGLSAGWPGWGGARSRMGPLWAGSLWMPTGLGLGRGASMVWAGPKWEEPVCTPGPSQSWSWRWSGRPASRREGRTPVSGGPGWVATPLREAAPLSDPGAGSAVGRNRGSWSRGLSRGL